ncbi:hypothetical protein J4474_02735, partial [Candidatus Pacearchaeota archaeon]|nr:hypothetical protein [Candidatus Pacearchaeota archaeon]
STQNLATDYRPLFKTKFFPCLYPPQTEKEMLERTLLELEATEIMKNSNFTNPRSIMTYPVFGFTFNIPFLE